MLRRAARLLATLPPTPAVANAALRVTANLAHSEAELGRVDVAEDMLRSAMARTDSDSDPEAVAALHNHVGLLLLRRGRMADSIVEFDQAIRTLDRDAESQCAFLLNRSAAFLYRGAARAAGDDLVRCERLAWMHELPVLVAKARHNLGYLELLRRDLPAALGNLRSAYEQLAGPAPGYCGIILLDRGRALRDAGLLDEADAELGSAAAVLTEYRLDQDLGETLLARAEIALMVGRLADARRYASLARRRFRRRHSDSWALLADLVLVQAGRATDARTAVMARDVAGRLAEAGLDDDARLAALVADRIEVRSGGQPGWPQVQRDDRIATRPAGQAGAGPLSEAAGDSGRTRRELRRGLADLRRHRTGLGSYDLQTAAGRHGRELIEAALRAAVRDGRPAVVHGWIEPTRAESLRLAPVRPPDDQVLATALAEMRAVRVAERSAELAGGGRDPELSTRRAALEREIRLRSPWQGGWRGVRPGPRRRARHAAR